MLQLIETVNRRRPAPRSLSGTSRAEMRRARAAAGSAEEGVEEEEEDVEDSAYSHSLLLEEGMMRLAADLFPSFADVYGQLRGAEPRFAMQCLQARRQAHCTPRKARATTSRGG